MNHWRTRKRAGFFPLFVVDVVVVDVVVVTVVVSNSVVDVLLVLVIVLLVLVFVLLVLVVRRFKGWLRHRLQSSKATNKLVEAV